MAILDFFPTRAYLSGMSDETSTTDGSGFARVLTGLLRPLVRAMIAQGVTAPALYRIVKQVYVDVAEREFQLDGSRQTDSRISMLTGVHRRDVRSMRGGDPADRQAEEKVTTIASVIGRWSADPRFRDAGGQPMALDRTGDVSFEALVRAVSTDIRPRTVLDELERQGLAEQSDGKVHLRAGAFLGPADPEQKIFFFAENVGDHISAAVDNLLSDEPKYMERAVFYNRLTASSVDEIEAEAKRLGNDTLVTLNEMAHARQSADLDAADGTERFRFGVFFYRTDDASDAASDIVVDSQGENASDAQKSDEPEKDGGER
jgi:hypothetical protein